MQNKIHELSRKHPSFLSTEKTTLKLCKKFHRHLPASVTLELNIEIIVSREGDPQMAWTHMVWQQIPAMHKENNATQKNSHTWGRLQKNSLDAGPHIPNLYFQVDVLSGYKSHLFLKVIYPVVRKKRGLKAPLLSIPF